MYLSLHVECPMLSDEKKIWIFSTHFNRCPIINFTKTERQTDMTTLKGAFRIYVNVCPNTGPAVA